MIESLNQSGKKDYKTLVKKASYKESSAIRFLNLWLGVTE